MKVFNTNVESKVLTHGDNGAYEKCYGDFEKNDLSRSQSISIIFVFLLIGIARG